jgi:hypothetical protein
MRQMHLNAAGEQELVLAQWVNKCTDGSSEGLRYLLVSQSIKQCR